MGSSAALAPTPVRRQPVACHGFPHAAMHRDHCIGDFETSPVRSFGEVSSSLLQSLLLVNPALSEDGTELANSYSTLGVAAESAPPTGWGGARNRAERESYALSTSQVSNLIEAARHADEIGLPLNRMITIHWGAAGQPLKGMAKATGRFFDLLTKWLARHGHRTAWLWVHENGEKKGHHCHALVHVPADHVPGLAARQKSWLRSITGNPYRAKVIRSKPLGGRLGVEVGNPALYAINLEAALAYVVKGADAEAASSLALVRLEPGGRVIGKRCGTSQNVGAKSRRLAGMKRIASIGTGK